jgi:putative effector of murein hydrolase LrgA (UPF0299 family)
MATFTITDAVQQDQWLLVGSAVRSQIVMLFTTGKVVNSKRLMVAYPWAISNLVTL